LRRSSVLADSRFPLIVGDMINAATPCPGASSSGIGATVLP